MTRAVVIGGGPVGLATAMLLADRGLDAIVLEKDAHEPPESPEDAWQSWQRHGVAQFRLAHTLLAAGCVILRHHLPEVAADLEKAGAHRHNLTAHPPSTIREWQPRPDDDRFEVLHARRPVYEYAFARAAARRPRVEIKRGAAVEALVTGEEAIVGVPHVAGVRTAAGEEIRADVVIDAGGRRSRIPDLIEAAGGRRPVDVAEDSRFAYYSRFYRRRGELPQPFLVQLVPVGSISLLAIPGDNDTWSITVYASSSDRRMRAARDSSVFERIVRAHPTHAAWVDGDPISEVVTMSGVVDRQRHWVVEGRPVATGLVPVGDAWACTNPSLGRGISIGLVHALHSVDAVVANLDDPAAMLDDWQAATEAHAAPWHHATLEIDRPRAAEMEALAAGRPTPVDQSGPMAALGAAFGVAAFVDERAYRWMGELAGCLTLPDRLFAREEVVDHITTVAAGRVGQPPPAPSRAQLEELLVGDPTGG